MPWPTLSCLCYRESCTLYSAAPSLFSVHYSLCQICNKNSSDVCDVNVQSALVLPRKNPGKEGRWGI